tara:strand:- start:293 stop:526 length:234 start_codon:yes stop_codon:yes gene_type:complete
MDKLEKILRKYLNNGSDRIDVTMVLALIQQCKKDTKEQLILSGVSQQREQLCAYCECKPTQKLGFCNECFDNIYSNA